MDFLNDLPAELKARLPSAPERSLFDSDEEFAQARGLWQMLVVRMIAADQARRSAAAEDGAAPAA